MNDLRLGGSLPNKPLKLRLKELREAQGMTVSQLSMAVGCSTTTITRLERGAGRPNKADLDRFAAALGVGPDELLAAEAEP
jgi:transcriptional regulator with XRE-family HTH domain